MPKRPMTHGEYSPFAWYYVKPVVFGPTVDGHPFRIRASEDQTPDVWTLFCLPQEVSWSARNTRVIQDYPSEGDALEALIDVVRHDKTIHLLGGQPPEPPP